MLMEQFKDKTVMVTGASGGIGYAVMQAFAAEGANVIACASRPRPEVTAKWDAVAAQYGVTVYPMFFDLADEEAIKAGLKEIAALKVPIEVLVNNAGVAAYGSVMMTGQEAMKRMFQVNYFGQVQITQHLAKMMLRIKKGAIVNVASIAGMEATPGNCSYGASKAAFISFTRVAAQEFFPFGIRVNAVAPGFIDTSMQNDIDKAIAEKEIQRQAIKRMGSPEEVAKAVLFLASDEASYITGQVLRVDGGI